MTTALLKLAPDDTIERYPYTLGDLIADQPHTSFALPLQAGDLAPYRVAVVAPVEPPPPTAYTVPVEQAPQWADGAWRQVWTSEARPEAEVEAAFVAALEAHYDATARSRRYDSRYTCALRAGYAGPFQSEGAAFAVWMDTCNAYAYSQLAAVQAGQRPPPASPAALVAELPQMVWPQ